LTSIRNRLTYANVMSTIAVVLTLGGATAMAAVVLGPNSVGTKQLKKDAVTAAKIKAGAVTSGKIGAGAVGGAELSDRGVATGKLGEFLGEDHEGSGEVTTTAHVGSTFRFAAMSLLAPPSPTSRTLFFQLNRITCATGSPVSATATALNAQVDVIGIR
jgi:hypothetical protein